MAYNWRNSGLLNAIGKPNWISGKQAAPIWKKLRQLPNSLPLVTMLLLALVIGTLSAAVSRVLIPHYDEPRSSYDVMSSFFKQRLERDRAAQPALLSLSVAELDIARTVYESATIKLANAVHELIIEYPPGGPAQATPLALSLYSGPDPVDGMEMLSLALFPSSKPIILEFQSVNPNAYIQLTRSSADKGSSWPGINIDLKKAIDQ